MNLIANLASAFHGAPGLMAVAVFAALVLPGGIPLVTLWAALRHQAASHKRPALSA